MAVITVNAVLRLIVLRDFLYRGLDIRSIIHAVVSSGAEHFVLSKLLNLNSE